MMKLQFGLTFALALSALSLASCGERLATGAKPGMTFIDAIAEVAKDPNCGHTDRVDIDLTLTGPRGKLFLERTCAQPLRSQPAEVGRPTPNP